MTSNRGQVSVGSPVYTADGEQLGTVKEVRGTSFKVDAPMQRDYWLSMDSVSSASSGEVRVTFDAGRLDDYQAAGPDETTTETTTRSAGATSDTHTTTTETTTRSAGATSGTPTWDTAGTTYRQNFAQRHASSGRRWEDAEPGYRFGHEMAADTRYRGREWNDAESSLRGEYDTWSRNQGYQQDEGGWDRVKDHAREAWDSVRGQRGGAHTEGTTTTTEGERTVQLREEQLQARTQSVEAGEVGIRKEVVTEEQTIEVPVTREEAVIERHPVEGRPSAEPIGEGETIRVPLHKEQVEVDKQPVVREEIEIGTRQVQDTERVSDTVRREEARVEHADDVDVRGEGTERTRRTDTRQA